MAPEANIEHLAVRGRVALFGKSGFDNQRVQNQGRIYLPALYQGFKALGCRLGICRHRPGRERHRVAGGVVA